MLEITIMLACLCIVMVAWAMDKTQERIARALEKGNKVLYCNTFDVYKDWCLLSICLEMECMPSLDIELDYTCSSNFNAPMWTETKGWVTSIYLDY